MGHGAAATIALGESMKSCKVVRLDSFVRKTNLKKVDFIKLDVEGAELEVLKGAERTLKRIRQSIIIYNYLHRTDVADLAIQEYITEFNHIWHFNQNIIDKLLKNTCLQLEISVTFIPSYLTVLYFILYELNKYGGRKTIRLFFYGLSSIIMWVAIILLSPLQVTSRNGADVLIIAKKLREA